MTKYARWKDIRAEHVERAGGEEAVEAGKQELLAKVQGHRLAEIRRSRGMTQQDIAQRRGSPRAAFRRSSKARSPDKTFSPGTPLLSAVSSISRSTSTMGT
ncbi:hypothetical protein [Nonomuraea sp. NPDC048916]|uniref:hypothetical protein n=1 Tax=Nonomuraea sp. NPDC048916 TaxID=3154232 RepID=UPI0034069611